MELLFTVAVDAEENDRSKMKAAVRRTKLDLLLIHAQWKSIKVAVDGSRCSLKEQIQNK